MSTTRDEDYHGQQYVEGQDAADVPARPGDEPDGDMATLGASPGQQTQQYSRVVMIGNYGILCTEHQTLTYNDITLAQAHKLKWDFFGACPCTMTCYDAHGEVAYEEG